MSLKTLFRWHLWLGLISGIFMFVIGLTGAIAVFAEEIDWLVIPQLRAHPAPDGRRADADTIIANLQARYPGARIGTLEFSVRPSFAHTASVSVRQPDGRNQARTAYIDPATGTVQGETINRSGYTGSVYQFIRQSHLRLLMGQWGRGFVGVFGVTLVLSCITGIWFYRGWIKKLFQLRLKGSWGGRPPWAELHKFIGVWSLVFNLVIGVTGAVYGLETVYYRVEREWFGTGRPAAVATAKKSAAPRPAATGQPLSPSALLAHARRAFPDLTVRTLSIPAAAGAPVSLTGDVPDPFVAQSHVRRRNSLRLDPITGAVISKVDGRDEKGWSRIYSTFDPIHFGYFGGLFTKVIWFILGMTPSFLAISGTWMWWRRRQTTRSASTPTPAKTEPTAPRWIAPVIALSTLACAYAIVARDVSNWTFTHQLAEHWLVKPVTLALIAFPVTALLCWLLWRWRSSAVLHALACLCMGGWYVCLTGLFPP
jgi:uncharacterized iron-regulated membrane protein